MTASILLALLAACCLGVAAFLQQRSAQAQVERPPFSLGLIRELMRERLWVGAVGVMILGYSCQAAALGLGQLTVVEPILAGYLVVALLIGWLWGNGLARRSSMAAALATSVGIAVFVVVAAPRSGRSQAPVSSWAVVLVALVLVLTGAARLTRTIEGSYRSPVLALVAGIALGCSDALTKQTLGLFANLGIGGLASWTLYTLVAVGAVAFLAQQSAYHAGPLARSLPVLSVAEPVIGVLLGVGIFGETPTAHGFLGVAELGAAAAAMVWGIRRLGREALATGYLSVETAAGSL